MSSAIDRKVFRNLSYGLYVLTSADGERKNGQIINTALQVTSDPPRVAVVVNKENLTHEYIVKSKCFGISVLEDSSPMTFIGLFGFRSGRFVDKLAKIEFKEGITGSPLVLEHALAVLEAEVVNRIDLGSHTIFIGDVVGSEIIRQGSPITYQYYHEVLKGKSPPSAPTFEPLVLRPPGLRSTVD
jgi:ferric-chelate reductase [NAD(P)H]